MVSSRFGKGKVGLPSRVREAAGALMRGGSLLRERSAAAPASHSLD